MNRFIHLLWRQRKPVLSFVVLLLSTSFMRAGAYDFVVAKDGSGNFTTVQAAVDAAAANSSAVITIFIKNGKYKEKITVPANKPNLQLIGESVANVILTDDDYAGRMLTCNSTVGTQNSASTTVNANDFSAVNITFENSHAYGVPDNNGQQAVAILVNADRAAFKNCRFIGAQDTMYLKGSGTPRHYFKSCYIDGLTDYIFGSAVALFDSCVLYNKARPGIASSYMVAPNTTTGQAYGFVFRNNRIAGNDGGTTFYLGRPWQNNPKAVFLNTTLLNYANILPAGWSSSSAGSATLADSYFAEYKTKRSNGTPADVSGRIAGSVQLSDAEAAVYITSNILGGWDPCAVATGFCDPMAPDIAVSNFRGTKGASSSRFDWNISWPMAGVQYTLYRSTDGVNYASVYTTTAATDSSVNFTYTDAALPPQGSVYSYYLIAAKAGFAAHTTDVIQIGSTPVLSVNAPAALSLCGFSQSVGGPSSSQTFTVAGSNLTSDITVTPPANFEVSLNGSTWFTALSPLVIPQSGGTVVTTTVYVRMNASTAGTYSGSIVNASAGAAPVNVAVSGAAAAPPTSFLLKAWPLTQDNNDSAAVRSAGVLASPSRLNNLFTSDGSSASANIPAYSAQYGQALGANTAGNNWSNVGGTLKNGYYEEFEIKSATGYTLRIDSIGFQSDFYLTTSNIKMGVQYSKNGFSSPADSTEYTSGVYATGSSGIAASGNFSKAFGLLRNDGGALNYYSLALNNSAGITLNAGASLTIRLYWACGSTGTPRFAFLKNVQIKGLAASNGPLPLTLLSFNAQKTTGGAKLLWQTANETAVSRFEAEKSGDGRAFTKIGVVAAKNLAGTNTYSLLDASFGGTAYYRLKMVDSDGREKWSNVVRLDGKASATLSVYPNPVVNAVLITHGAAADNATMELFSAKGELVKRLAVAKGATRTEITATGLPAGTYLLNYTDSEKTASQVLLKQ